MNFDDVEHFLEGILAGLKARKEIAPLQEKISKLIDERERLAADKISLNRQVETLTNQRDNFKRQLAETQENFNRREEELRTAFNRELDKAKQRILDMQDDFRQESDDLKADLKAANEARQIAEDTANFYRKTYGELDAAYKIYSTLDEATRFDLAGIFGAGDTVAGFFSGAVQQEHLAPFWDYVSRHSDKENLVRLFNFCFETFNRGFREPPYTRLAVEPDNFFDADFMRRTSQSRQMGKVSRVVLQGYCYSGGNVVKKSIVELA